MKRKSIKTPKNNIIYMEKHGKTWKNMKKWEILTETLNIVKCNILHLILKVSYNH